MLNKDLVIINKLGLHARAAAKLVSIASKYACDVQVGKDGRLVNGKSIMGVMMLAASQNSEVTITTDGKDELDALQEIESLIMNRFGEDE